MAKAKSFAPDIAKKFAHDKQEGATLVDLRGCQLKSVPATVPESVEVLELSDNELRTFPKRAVPHDHLKRLGLRYADVRNLEADLWTWTTLEDLDLFGCNVKIPAELAQLENLRKLRLSTVVNAKLPIDSDALPPLEMLYLGNAEKLPDLPESLLDLELNENHFRGRIEQRLPALRRYSTDVVAPIDFAKFPKLVELEYKGDDSELPKAVLEQTQLVDLRLSSWVLPDKFANLRALRKLELFNCNPLPRSLLKLSQLETLKLDLVELEEADIKAVLAAMPNVSLSIDLDAWPEPKKRETGKALIENPAPTLPYKRTERLAALRKMTALGLAALGAKLPLDHAIAEYVALRHGFELVADKRVATKDKTALSKRLLDIASAQPTHAIKVRSLVDQWRAWTSHFAAAILAIAKPTDAAVAAMRATREHENAMGAASAVIEIEALLALDRTADAVSALHGHLELFPKDEALKPLQLADWYR